MLVVVGLSHHNAPVEVRERLALAAEALPRALASLAGRPAVGEVMFLSTCNRVEVFAAPAATGEGAERAIDEIIAELETLAGAEVRPYLIRRTGVDAVAHLFRVASSLDSLVVGEPQILGQVKTAFEAAQAAGSTGPALERAVSRALHAAKRVRSETAIGEGLVSIASVAVDLSRQIFGDLMGRRALLLGAGQMAEGAAQLLVRAGARVEVLNRSPERATALAAQLGAVARPLEDLGAALVDADVVVASTSSPGFVLTRDDVARAHKRRRGRALFVIDIAVPRDVEPSVGKIDNIFLYDVDDLEAVVRDAFASRKVEALRAEAVVAEEVSALGVWAETREVVPTLVALRQKTRATLGAELDRSLGGKLKHLSAADRAALGQMLDSAVSKLMHAPTTNLKRAAAEPGGANVARIVREVFDLSESTAQSTSDGASNALDEKKG